MSHPPIASLSFACLLGILALPAHAADDTAFAAPNPLLSSHALEHGNFAVLHVKSAAAGSRTHMAPVIYGPDFVPKGPMRAGSSSTGASKLEGEQFRFH